MTDFAVNCESPAHWRFRSPDIIASPIPSFAEWPEERGYRTWSCQYPAIQDLRDYYCLPSPRCWSSGEDSYTTLYLKYAPAYPQHYCTWWARGVLRSTWRRRCPARSSHSMCAYPQITDLYHHLRLRNTQRLYTKQKRPILCKRIRLTTSPHFPLRIPHPTTRQSGKLRLLSIPVPSRTTITLIRPRRSCTPRQLPPDCLPHVEISPLGTLQTTRRTPCHLPSTLTS